MVQNITDKKKVTVQDLQKLARLLNFLNRAVVPGRAFTRRIYSKFSGVNMKGYRDKKILKPFHHIRVYRELCEDCRMWLQFLQGEGHNNLGLHLYMPFTDLSMTLTADVLKFYMDAVKGKELGFGGVFNKHWIFGRWEENFITSHDPSIEFLELYAVAIAVFAWNVELRGKRIVLFCDNQSVVHMINNSSSSCHLCMILIRLLTLKSLRCNMRVFACWVRGACNTEANLLSRQEIQKFQNIADADIDEHPTPLPSQLWPLSRLLQEYDYLSH